MMKKTLGVITAIALCAGSSEAAFITGTTIQSADVGSNANMSPDDAISGTGLNDGTGQQDQPALSGTHSTEWRDHWWSNSATGQITIDLEGNYSIDAIHIWNYNEGGGGTGRAIQDASIWVSADENEANLVKLDKTSGTHSNGSGDFTLPDATRASNYTGFDLDLSNISNASLLDNVRLVRIQGITTYGQSTNGLGEVSFDGGAPIPEPSSLALLGLGGLLIARRRRG